MPITPDWFVRRLKAIDEDLRLEWLPREKKWAICQRLHNTPSIESRVHDLVAETQTRLADAGRVIPRDQLSATLYAIVAREDIVLRLEDPDTAAPLEPDVRYLQIMERRAYLVRNRNLAQWKAVMDDVDYEAKRQRELHEADMFGYLAKDAIFKRLVSDAAAGLKIQTTIHGRPDRAPAAQEAPTI
jgi:hypothetical protein